MEKITSVAELKEAILLLEIERANEKHLLKEEFKKMYESLQPVNLIKSGLRELTTAPDFKGNILNTVVSIAAGYLSKKVIVGGTLNPLKQLLGGLLQMGVTNAVSKNGEGIKTTALHLLSKLFNKKDTPTTGINP